MGVRKRWLLSEGLFAAGASPTNDQAWDLLNQLVNKNVEFPSTSLMALECVGHGMAGRARRQNTGNFVLQHVVTIALDLGKGR